MSTQSNISYPFPGRAEDLPNKHYWFVKKSHKGGIQSLGFDMTTVRFSVKENKWTQRKVGVSASEYQRNPTNDKWSVYGRPVYAIADGEVMWCWRNAPENPTPGADASGEPLVHPDMDGTKISNAGNFLKVKHSDQEFVLYAHFKPGTIPSSLCPFDKPLRDKVDDAEIKSVNKPQVKKGQFLGLVGNSGHSYSPHLHINLQKTLFDNGGSANALPMPFDSAWIKSTAKLEDSPDDWKRLQGEILPVPDTAILPDYSTGFPEIARHGVPASEYQFTFEHITNSGYRLVWIDGYEVNGANFFNAIFRLSDGTPWKALHGLSSAQYQNAFDTLPQGFRPLQVESYTDGNLIRYAVIFVKQIGPVWTAYHGKTAEEHQNLFNSLTKEQGFRPINTSVVSVGGQRSYTALYEKKNVGSFKAHSFLTPNEYQTKFNENSTAGRQLVYLNAYNHGSNGIRFSAIWHSAVSGSTIAKHGLNSANYQEEWKTATDKGFLTQCVTGYDAGINANFAAFWRKE